MADYGSRRWFGRSLLGFGVGLIIPTTLLERCQNSDQLKHNKPSSIDFRQNPVIAVPEIDLLIPTYLGNDQRCFYGRGKPHNFKLVDRFWLGTGKTAFQGITEWSGAGWTGQPTLVSDRQKIYLVIGSYDHHLRKIDISNNQEVWRYKFDDIIKGTATIYIDETASEENRIVILQGSRLGLGNYLGQAEPIPSLRAISFRTGKELWRLDVRLTDSYSRDHDSSALFLGNGLVFTAGENGIGYFLDSSAQTSKSKDGIRQPLVHSEVVLYQPNDIYRHGGNLVTESSPARLGNMIYIASGSGHVFGIDIRQKAITWDFFVGTDLDGTVAIAKDQKLFIAVEKQYNSGQGGVLKLNPQKPVKDAVEWFLPTGNISFAGWEGGIIGSVALNDDYNLDNQFPPLFAVVALDGFVYIGSQNKLSGQKVLDPNQSRHYDSPLILYKKLVGSSIATPIFTDDHHLIVPTYNGVHWFKINFQSIKQPTKSAIANQRGELFKLQVSYKSVFMEGVSFESTPIIWNNLVRICSRDGFLYTIG